MRQTRNRSRARLLSLSALGLTLLLAALPAWAAGGEDVEMNVFGGDLGNILWTLITFGLVVFVLGKFAWGPLQDTLEKRESFIRDSLEQAKKDRESAEARLKEYEERLAEARAEATSIVEEGRRDAEVTRQRIEEDARAEADKMIERAKREIGIARETAVKDLYERSGLMASEIAGRIVGRELDAKAHEKLISEALSQLSEEAN
ncbi:MAG: F0F1 ATP synthase subunit B [Acidobacteriota bacterium]